MIVLDTNVVSEVWRARSDANVMHWFERQNEFELFLCIPVIAELSYGAHRTLLRDKSLRYMKALHAMTEGSYRSKILPCDLASAMMFGEVVALRETVGRPIGPMDAMIAAICLVHGATLATRNTRDFGGLDLELVNPFEAGAQRSAFD
jgi:predicted nucleic acid-binding protein